MKIIICFTTLFIPSALSGPADPVPLLAFFNNAITDSLLAAQEATIKWALAHGYKKVRQEGMVFPVIAGHPCSAGTYPLVQLWNEARRDHMLFLNTSSADFFAHYAGKGWQATGTEGCAWPHTDSANFGGSNEACALLQSYRTEEPANNNSDTRGVISLTSTEELRGDFGAKLTARGYQFLSMDACTPTQQWTVWPSTPPADCPFKPSERLSGISFSGRVSYFPSTGADSWFPSWGADGNLYSTFTDGVVGLDTQGTLLVPEMLPPKHAAQLRDSHEVFCCSSCGVNTTQNSGAAILIGNDPFRLRVRPRSCITASGYPYQGRYPSGSLHCDGIWYIATVAAWPWLHGENGCAIPAPRNSAGPLIGLHISRDGKGLRWEVNTTLNASGTHNLFREQGGCQNSALRMEVPRFVDFGRNMAGARSPASGADGRAYMIGHGCLKLSPDYVCSWITGDSVHLARTKAWPNPDRMNDPDFWEFYAGKDLATGADKWMPQVSAAVPLFVWPPSRVGGVSMTWNEGLGLYLIVMVTAHNASDPHGQFKAYDTYVLESPTLTGPFRLVSYMGKFGEQAYCTNLVSKFWSEGGTVGILAHSSDFTFNDTAYRTKPYGGRYGLVMRELRLDLHPQYRLQSFV